jgi:hypothetical protein
VNTEIARLWSAALRSGKYRQGRDYLAKTDADGVVRYCCLGVLCELAIQAGVELTRRVTATGTVSYDNCQGTLPGVVVRWADLESDNPRLGVATAVRLNDDQRVSFERIADVVDKHLVKGVRDDNDAATD